MPKYKAVLSVGYAIVEIEAENEQYAREEAWLFGSNYFQGKVIEVDLRDILEFEEVE